MSLSVPATMKAIGLPTATGGVELLQEIEVPVPALKPRDILIKLKACGLNPVDTKQRSGGGGGGAPLDEPRILGYDGCGVVAAVGSEASLFKVGDKVYTAGVLSRNGTNAAFVAVDEQIVGFAPKTLPPASAAAVPLTLITAWEGLFEGLAIKPLDDANLGKTLLILPGAGGVGSLVIQLAKKLAGLTVIATASRPESEAAVRALGADHVINHRNPLKPQLEANGLSGVDYIYNAFDIAANFDQYCEIVNPLGKIVSIASTEKDLPLTKLMFKRVTFAWEMMFMRAMCDVEPIKQHHILNNGAKFIDEGLLKLPDVAVLPYSVESLQEAHRRQESGTVIGKQVFTME